VDTQGLVDYPRKPYWGQALSYRLEAEMTPVVLRSLERRGFLVRPEFAAPWGVCDLVGVEFDPARVRHRLALGQLDVIGPPVRIELLSRIPTGATGSYAKISRLRNEFSGILDEDRLGEELARLERAGFVEFPKRGAVHRLNGWVPLQRQIVAVELKLSRPLEALNQAVSHLRFADKSYVALPAELAHRVVASSRRRVFMESGVGLFAVEQNRCRTAIEPGPSSTQVDTLLQMHCVERFWRTRTMAYRRT